MTITEFIKRAREELRFYRDSSPNEDDTYTLAKFCDDNMEAMVDSLEEMKEALEFYQDQDRWDTENISPTIWNDGNIDLGDTAKACLAKIEERFK